MDLSFLLLTTEIEILSPGRPNPLSVLLSAQIIVLGRRLHPIVLDARYQDLRNMWEDVLDKSNYTEGAEIWLIGHHFEGRNNHVSRGLSYFASNVTISCFPFLSNWHKDRINQDIVNNILVKLKHFEYKSWRKFIAITKIFLPYNSLIATRSMWI